jgi:hypothetical protein
MAIALACIIVLFPQTLHSVVLDGTIKACFKPCLVHLQLQEQVLQTKSADHDKWSELAEKLRALRTGQIEGINGIGGQIKLLELEISRSRMGPGDLAKVFEKSKELCVRAYMLGSFVVSRIVYRLRPVGVGLRGVLANRHSCGRWSPMSAIRVSRSGPKRRIRTRLRDSSSTPS